MTQQPLAPPLTQQLTLDCLDPRGRSLELVVALGYDATDPYAVTITFPVATGDVCWVICRATLLRGLSGPSGQGDLRLWPSIDEDGRAVVVLEFCSPDGRLAAQAATAEVQRFVTRTLAVVPAGTEGDHLDLDALVADLLGSAPR